MFNLKSLLGLLNLVSMRPISHLFKKISLNNEVDDLYNALLNENGYLISKEVDQRLNINKQLIQETWEEINLSPDFFEKRMLSPRALIFLENIISNQDNFQKSKMVFYKMECSVLKKEHMDEAIQYHDYTFKTNHHTNVISDSLKQIKEIKESLTKYMQTLPLENQMILDEQQILKTKNEAKYIKKRFNKLIENAKTIYSVSTFKIYRQIAIYNSYVYYLHYDDEVELLDVRNVFSSICLWNSHTVDMDLQKLNDPKFDRENDWKSIRLLRKHKIERMIRDVENYQINIQKLMNTIYDDILRENGLNEAIFNELVEKNYLNKSTPKPVQLTEYLSIDIYSCDNRFLKWYLQSRMLTFYNKLGRRKDKSVFWLSIVLSFSTTLLALATVALAIVTGIVH